MDNSTEQYIYCASIRLRNGKRIFARHYGKKAFRIKVKRDLPPDQPCLPNLD